MNCFQARRVVKPDGAASDEDRTAALAHFDGCAACSREAPEIDPLLALRRLPELEVGPSEVKEMQRAVARLRRMPPASRSVRGRWMQAAAAAAVALGLLLHPRVPEEERSTPSQAAEPTESAALEPAWRTSDVVASVETLGPASAYVATQVAQEDLTLVILANVDVGGR